MRIDPDQELKLECGISIDDRSVADILALCEATLGRGEPVHICTVNPEIAEVARRDAGYAVAVKAASVRTADGSGVAAALSARYRRWVQRVTGVRLLSELVDWARSQSKPVCIIGADPDSRRTAEMRLSAMGVVVHPGQSPMVTRDGEIASPGDAAQLPRDGVVLVALGVPKQELWIRHQIESGAPPNVYVGVGGAVDYLSGQAQLPPAWIRKAGLEWIYRLCREPRTRLRRQVSTIPRFVWHELLRRREKP